MSNFKHEVKNRIRENGENVAFQKAANHFMMESGGPMYTYNFSYLGRPIIQYPQDMVAVQELIWGIKPDLIIEMGIAHGGSLIMSASMLALLDICEAINEGITLDPAQSKRKVLGVDIDIRDHNKKALNDHPMRSRIQMIEGSSIAPEVIKEVHNVAKGYEKIMVCLDSNHTHDHVLAELDAYSSLTTLGSYCIVFDTLIEDMPSTMFNNREWGPGDNPKTAVWEFLKSHPEFEIDKNIQNKLLITVAPDGFLKRIS